MSHYTTAELIQTAHNEMTKWDLISKGWSFVTTENKSRHGWCKSWTKQLSVSLHSMRHNSKEDVLDTIRHEIAHALVYVWKWDNNIHRKIQSHGREWKTFAVKVGATPKSGKKGAASSRDDAPWVVVYVDGDKVVSTQARYYRLGADLKGRYMRGNKRATLDNMYYVNQQHWNRVQENRLDVNRLAFHRSKSVTKTFANLVAA
jgi:hypothetical protein